MVAVLAVLVGLPSLVFPFGRDQGNYAYAGWVWLEGGALYRDVFVFKPPATAVLHGLATGLFGRAMSSIRLFDLGWTAATAVVTTAILLQLGARRAVAGLGGVFGAYVYYEQNYWTTAQTDGWMGLPAGLALLATLRGRAARDAGAEARAWWVLAGVSAAVAVSFKYTAATIALPMGVVLLQGAAGRVGDRLKAALGVAVAGLATIAAMGAWLWAEGAWDAFVDCQFHLVPGYVDHVEKAKLPYWPFTIVMDLVTGRRLRMGAVTLFLAAPLLVRLVRPGPDRAAAWVVFTWLVAGLASCAAQGRYFGYHYLMAVPPLGAAAALGIATVAAPITARVRSVGVRLVLAVSLGAALVGTSEHVGHTRHAWATWTGRATLEQSWRRTTRYRTGDFSLKDDLRLADWLVANTAPTDRVFLWGFEPLVNYVAGRHTVSRFLYNYPFAVSWGNPAYEGELMEALRATPPAIVVVSSGDATPGVTGNRDDSRALFQKFDALRTFVEASYTRVETLARFDVYRRNTP